MAKIDLEFLETEWFTPNTYDVNFKDPPCKPGVYLLVWFDFIPNGVNKEVLYVGSSKNLLQRYTGHEVLRILSITHGYIRFYFQECESYFDREKELIKFFSPIFNTKHNG